MQVRIPAVCLILLLFVVPFAWADSLQDALQAARSGNYTKAHALWLTEAKKGCYRSQYNIGLLYYNGRGVLQDYKEAAKWYQLAAAQGDADAQNNLGMIL